MSVPYIECLPYPPAPLDPVAGLPYSAWPEVEPVPYDHSPDRQYERAA